jgi:peptidoglycan/LPS O-acetylase OafA/YrhL
MDKMTQQSLAFAPQQPHVPWLDGLRGIAAAWVVLSHIRILTGLPDIPVLSWGGLAVDLFMMLSGFLMVHHYILRQDREPWDKMTTATSFWQRRFFRIAPLYYVLLIVALIFGPSLGHYRDLVAEVWPRTATAPARYLDQSLSNIVTHLTFSFGALPKYAFRTALPDWSIGLEMQFYLVFPLLMLLIRKFGSSLAAVALSVISLLSVLVFPGYFDQFEMPAFLPLRLHVFLVGMLIATGLAQGRLTRNLAISLLILALSGAVVSLKLVIAQIGVTVFLFYIMDKNSLPFAGILQRPLAWIRAVLSNRQSVFLGNTSYAVYLLHLMILLPIAGSLAEIETYRLLPAVLRFGLIAAILFPTVYILAWGLYNFIERPGIKFGRHLSKGRRSAVNTSGIKG